MRAVSRDRHEKENVTRGHAASRPALRIALLGSLAFVLGCGAAPTVIPAELEGRVDRSVAFTDLLASPGSYKGRTVVLGGEVLSATLLQDRSRIEVLQLPLDNMMAPVTERSASEGRFLAITRKMLDPATIPAGTRVTVVGEVTDPITLPLDARRYTYPTLEVKALTVWPKRRAAYWYIPYPLLTPGGPVGGR